jgi:predicted nucleic acid-binding protein
MKIVIDSNVLFSALISGQEKHLDIIKMNDVYMPDIVLYEMNKYENRIITKAKLKQADFRLFVRMLFEKVVVIPKFAISPESWHEAYKICRDIDEKDTPFIALSLEFEIPLWTNDKSLFKRLKEKGFDNFVTIEELMNLIERDIS